MRYHNGARAVGLCIAVCAALLGATRMVSPAVAQDAPAAVPAQHTPRDLIFPVEEFTGDFDLAGHAVLFTPDGSAAGYAACVYPIIGLPTNPYGGTPLTPADDAYTVVTLTAGHAVVLYGVFYNTLYVSPNGCITFGAGDTDASPSLANHFRLPRVAALFNDFDARFGGFTWQERDRAVVTWDGLPLWGTWNVNTFQAELFFDGRIRLSWLDIDVQSGICGLSPGNGVPAGFVETDLSAAAACSPRPPWASGMDVGTPQTTPVSIELRGADDGLPEPPGALQYVIQSLPAFELRDAGNGHLIRPADLPYTLSNSERRVIYRPFSLFRGHDGFEYHVHDGGTPPLGGASESAAVRITVGGPQPVIRFALDADPGWSRTGLWQFGAPLGGGSPPGDPLSGHTGTNVFGYNLAGDYENDLVPRYLTSSILNCSQLVGVELHFWRRLSVEDAAFDRANVQLSTNGTSWTTIWEHVGPTRAEAAWSEQVLDIAALADGRPAVYVRWGLGPTDVSVTYPGWNLDDIEIWAEVPALLGDMNCDGSVDFDDINPFVAALVGPLEYAALDPDCDNFYFGDANGDGAVDFDDINPFVAALAGNP